MKPFFFGHVADASSRRGDDRCLRGGAVARRRRWMDGPSLLAFIRTPPLPPSPPPSPSFSSSALWGVLFTTANQYFLLHHTSKDLALLLLLQLKFRCWQRRFAIKCYQVLSVRTDDESDHRG